MTSVERFLIVSMTGCSLVFGAFVSIAHAEGVLVLAVPAFFLMVLVIGGLSAWGWRQEYGHAPATTARRAPLRVVLGGLLHLALVTITVVLALANKDGLAIVTGLLAASVAALLARSQLRRSRTH